MPSPSSANLRILVIDDDVVMSEVLLALLSMQGHTVTSVPSGDAALPLLAPGGPDLDVILTDLHMPGLQGHALAEQLHAVRRAPTVIIGMSGSRPTAAEMKLFDAFLRKPFSTEDFAATLQSAMEHGSARSEASHSVEQPAEGVLDDKVFSQLAKDLPAPQLRELYRMAVADVRTRVARIEASTAQGDFAAVRREAHAIKGGCGMVGALELQRVAAGIENGGTEEGARAGTPGIALFAEACERLQRMLDARL